MNLRQKNILRSYILRSKYVSEKDLATEVLGISGNSFSRKLNGHNQFTAAEIQKLKENLGVSDKDVIEIFFR